jgi:hypothetical protein
MVEAEDSRARCVTVELDDHGVLVVRMLRAAHLDGPLTQYITDAMVSLSGGRPRPPLGDIRHAVTMNAEGRRAARRPEVDAVVSRFAVLVGNPATRVIANFFIRVSTPPYPTRVFNDEASGRAWLDGASTS